MNAFFEASQKKEYYKKAFDKGEITFIHNEDKILIVECKNNRKVCEELKTGFNRPYFKIGLKFLGVKGKMVLCDF